jgi:hypothetical protein
MPGEHAEIASGIEAGITFIEVHYKSTLLAHSEHIQNLV